LPNDLFKLPTGTSAVRAISAKPVGAADGLARQREPGCPEFALSLLGFMSPNTRLPVVELAEAAKAEVASAIAEIGDEDLGCPVENWRGRRFHKDTAATL
jgi:hypothetical protein